MTETRLDWDKIENKVDRKESKLGQRTGTGHKWDQTRTKAGQNQDFRTKTRQKWASIHCQPAPLSASNPETKKLVENPKNISRGIYWALSTSRVIPQPHFLRSHITAIARKFFRLGLEYIQDCYKLFEHHPEQVDESTEGVGGRPMSHWVRYWGRASVKTTPLLMHHILVECKDGRSKRIYT